MTDQNIAQTSKKGFPKWAIILIIVIAVIAVIGYAAQKFFARKITEGIIEKTIESQTGAKIDLNTAGDGSFKVTNDEGSLEIGNTAEWPADMPSSVRKFSAGTIMSSMKNSQNGNSWAVIIKDIEQTAVNSYITDLQGAGWKSVNELKTIVSITQLEKDNLDLNIAYDPSSKGLNITVTEKAVK